MDILTYFLIVLCLIIPFGVFERIQIIPSVFVYLHDLAVLPIFLFIIYKILIKKEVTRPGILKGLLLFSFIGFASLLVNSFSLNMVDYFISLSYLLRFLMYASLIFAFDYLGKKKISILLKTLNLSLLFFVFSGFLQYLFSPSLKQFYVYGWDEHFYRLTGTYLDPNFAGISILLYVILLFYFLIKTTNGKKRIVYTFVSLFLGLFSMFLTYSRSTAVAFIFSIPVFLAFEKKKKLFLTVLVVVIFAGIITPKNFNLVGLNPFRVFSSVERLKSIENAYKIFTSSPLYGVGFNAYRYAQKRVGFLDNQWENTHSGAGASNSFMFILATTGIFGIFTFMYFIWQITRYFTFGFKSSSSRLRTAVVLASLVAVLVHSMFDNTFFYPFTMLILFYIVGIMGVKD